MALVYQIICNITGKVYVGWTSLSVEKRWKRHLVLDKKCYLANCIRRYGPEHFSIDVIADGLGTDEAKAMETRLIAELKLNICRYPNGSGMNMTDGGEGTIGFTPTEAQKKAMAAARTGLKRSPAACEAMSRSKQGDKNPAWKRPKTARQLESARTRFLTNNPHKPGKDSHRYGKPSPVRGRPLSAETKRKLSERLKGRPRRKRTEEERKRMSETTRRYLAEHGHPCLGKKASPESRERMRQARLARLQKEAAEGFKRRNTPETIEKMRAAAKRRVERQKAAKQTEED